MRVGGFYRAPRKRELAALVEPLERAREIALETVRSTAGFDFPDYAQDYELVALAEPGEYPIDRGRIVSNRGLDIAGRGVRRALRRGARRVLERAALARASARGSYLCGPLARFALAFDRLSPLAREAAAAAGLDASERNPFRSIVVRAVELVYAADEALRLIAEYEEPDAPAVEVEPRAGVGYGATEAPRGLLYHRYRLDDDGHDPRRQDRAADLAEPARRSRTTCAASSSARSTSPTTSSRCSASRRSATTTRASRARRTSSTLEVERC